MFSIFVRTVHNHKCGAGARAEKLGFIFYFWIIYDKGQKSEPNLHQFSLPETLEIVVNIFIIKCELCLFIHTAMEFYIL
jgi:hypothetical protein